jgi:ABC-2 type transport system ATP-binding protein
MSAVIRLIELSKIFGRGENAVNAVVNLNLEIQPSQVYGFLGPNGAGKTTTIRLMMGLIRPTEGIAKIFDLDVRRNPGVFKRVGGLVEDATFYGYLSGSDNLEVLARTAGDHRPHRIALLLEQVGLTKDAQRKVSGYSTGMKQRLGIAAALLSDPELVILDEPTNGLDPGGRQEMRDFIRELVHGQGKTVFLSSHILHEVEQVCDRVAIINYGEIVREGAVADLLKEGKSLIDVEASPMEAAAQVLGENWDVSIDGNWLIVSIRPELSHKVVEQLVKNDVQVHQVVVRKRTLEEYFLDATRVGGVGQNKVKGEAIRD